MIRSTQSPLPPTSLPSTVEHACPTGTATAFPTERAPTLQTLLTASPHADAPCWGDRMTQICEDHPPLSTSLRWFLGNVPLAEIAQFLDSGIEVLADALDASPDLADGILMSWESALARRHPAESLEAICLRVTSPSNLRDIRRSVTRAAARDDVHVAVCGESWAQSVSDTFQWLRMAGTGFDPNIGEADYEQRRGEITSFITTIERAIQQPQSPAALSLRESLVRLHSSVEASAAETRLGLFDLDKLEQEIVGGPQCATYLVTTRSHSMSIVVEPAGTVVYEPNFGIGAFRSTGDALKAFGALMHRGDLARHYGAFDAVGEMKFVLKRLDVEALGQVDVGGTKVADMAVSTWE